MRRATSSRRSAFERAYSVVAAVKGIDGLVELIAGLVLLVAQPNDVVATPSLGGRVLVVLDADAAALEPDGEPVP